MSLRVGDVKVGGVEGAAGQNVEAVPASLNVHGGDGTPSLANVEVGRSVGDISLLQEGSSPIKGLSRRKAPQNALLDGEQARKYLRGIDRALLRSGEPIS
jgi:hypothetical protein